MHTTAVWAALMLAQSASRLLVEGTRSRYVEPISLVSSGESGEESAENEPRNEPTCEELRAMWRDTKRQSRATHVIDPYAYAAAAASAWKTYPPPPLAAPLARPTRPRTRAAGGMSASASDSAFRGTFESGYRGGYVGSNAPVYGRIVHKAPAGSRLRGRMFYGARAFEDPAHLYGTINFHPPSPRRRLTSVRIGGGASPPISQVPQAGSFQHLRDLIRSERARELREQHVADKIAARTNGFNEYSNGDYDPYRTRKYSANSLDEHQQFKNAKFDGGRAWSRNDRYLSGYMLP